MFSNQSNVCLVGSEIKNKIFLCKDNQFLSCSLVSHNWSHQLSEFIVYSGAHYYMDGVTVTDGCTEGFNERDMHGYTTVSLVLGERLPN
jgi:hypothetical protein